MWAPRTQRDTQPWAPARPLGADTPPRPIPLAAAYLLPHGQGCRRPCRLQSQPRSGARSGPSRGCSASTPVPRSYTPSDWSLAPSPAGIPPQSEIFLDRFSAAGCSLRAQHQNPTAAVASPATAPLKFDSHVRAEHRGIDHHPPRCRFRHGGLGVWPGASVRPALRRVVGCGVGWGDGGGGVALLCAGSAVLTARAVCPAQVRRLLSRRGHHGDVQPRGSGRGGGARLPGAARGQARRRAHDPRRGLDAGREGAARDVGAGHGQERLCLRAERLPPCAAPRPAHGHCPGQRDGRRRRRVGGQLGGGVWPVADDDPRLQGRR